MIISAFFANRLASRPDTDLLLLPFGYEKSAAALWETPKKNSENDSSYSGVIAATVAVLGEQWITDRLLNLNPLFEAKPKTPHWYLAFIGTRPEERGKGLASVLIAEITKICDEEKIPAYLESSNPENVSLYENHGFKSNRIIKLLNLLTFLNVLTPAAKVYYLPKDWFSRNPLEWASPALPLPINLWRWFTSPNGFSTW